MPQSFGQNWQDVNDAALDNLGAVARESMELVMSRVNKDHGAPLKLYATFPTPDAVLNIGPGTIELGDGAARISPPADDTFQSYAGAGINFQTAAITGTGVVTRSGAAFSLPTTIVGRFRRAYLIYKSTSNSVDVYFEPSANGYADLGVLRSTENPGVVFSALDGIPLGYIDLEATAANAFKTPASATNIIQNKVGADKVLYRIGSGAGSGSGGDSSFKLQSIASNIATFKKGSIKVYSTGQELYLGANLSVALKTDPLSGVLAPAINTQYYVYLDLQTLAAQSSVGVSDRKVYAIVATNFVVLATIPELVNTARYVPIASVLTDGSANYTLFDNLALRPHVSAPVSVSPIVETIGPRSIGAVGAVANAQGALVDGDITFASSAYFPLNSNITNSASLGGNLTNVGGVFDGVGFFGRENLVHFFGNEYLTSVNSHFNPGNGVSWSTGGWIKSTNMAKAFQMLVSQVGSAADRGFNIQITPTVVTIQATNTAGSYDTSVTATHNFKSDEWHHIVGIFDFASTRLKIYIDGQLSGFATLANVRTVTSPKFNISGQQDGVADEIEGYVQDVFFTRVALTDAQVNAVYSKRFANNAQIAGGHKLTNDSFPFSSLTGKVSYYNLDNDDGATILDDSGNGFGLTKTGTIAFNGLGLTGLADSLVFDTTAKKLESTDQFFNGNGDFSIGSWVYREDWYSGGVTNTLAIEGNNTSDYSYFLFFDNAGNFNYRIGTAATTWGIYSSHSHGIKGGGWHHIAVVYKGLTATVFIDGVSVASTLSSGARRSASSPLFRIGTHDNTAYFKGNLSNFFYCPLSLSDSDIRKLYSSRIDLTDSSVLPANQGWKAYHESEDGKTLNEYNSNDWLLDKRSDKIYVDFGGASGNKVTLRKSDLAMSTRAIATKDFRRVFTSDPTGTIAHGLPEKPAGVSISHDSLGDGKFAPLNPADHVKFDATNIYLAGFTGLTIGASTPVELVASVSPIATAVNKKSLDNMTPDVVEVTAARTATNGDQVILKTGAGIQTLPLSPAIGSVVVFMDGGVGLSTANVTVARNGQFINGAASDYILDVSNTKTEFRFVGGSRGWQSY